MNHSTVEYGTEKKEKRTWHWNGRGLLICAGGKSIYFRRGILYVCEFIFVEME